MASNLRTINLGGFSRNMGSVLAGAGDVDAHSLVVAVTTEGDTFEVRGLITMATDQLVPGDDGDRFQQTVLAIVLQKVDDSGCRIVDDANAAIIATVVNMQKTAGGGSK